MEQLFTTIYEKERWGSNKHVSYKGSSGSGSSLSYNKKIYIPFLKQFIQDNNIKSVVDLGCGDFRCGTSIYDDLQIQYFGYDVYKTLIDSHTQTFTDPKYTFIHLDFFSNKEQIQSADLCILKDVLQHWSLTKIHLFLDWIQEKKQFKYVLLISGCNQTQDNTDIKDGGFRHLNSEFLPLRKYSAKRLLLYKNKEVCLIE
jgi:hypothetical protein